MAQFRLSKWYLDCIDESGDVSILYAGSAHWRAFSLRYASVLQSAGGAMTSRRSLRRIEYPSPNGESLVWRCPPLHVDGQWHSDAEALQATVFSSDAGNIEWRCLMPRARTRIAGHQGLGYVERLDMTIAPWRLPLRTLRWGRFGAESDWIVWIDWDGEPARRLVYRNGRAEATLALGDDRIEFADAACLRLDRSLVIREGAIGATALAGIPGLRHSLPGRLLRIAEHKWRSLARLERPGMAAVSGWAIHERVEWPK